MPIILQITAWAILAVGLLALGYKFFPNFKQWFTSGKISYVWLIAITLGLFVLLTYPYFFNWWAVNFWNVPEGELTDLTKLGPLGDIYGSLNTIFTSATLAFVVYATFLQRQANIDARIAMNNQLQQARDATAKQLRQARQALKQQLDQSRESTEQQIANAKTLSDLQLEHVKATANAQLTLAQATHDAQIRESQHAIFTTKFYGLLNYKKDNLNSIFLKKYSSSKTIEVSGINVIEALSSRFVELLKEKPNKYNDFEETDLEADLYSICDEMGYRPISKIIAYYFLYIDLFNLLNTSDISDQDKTFYRSVISNSMTQHEQIFLFWIAPSYSEIDLENSEVFSMFGCMDCLIPYAEKFHNSSHFKYEAWKGVFYKDFMAIEETPA